MLIGSDAGRVWPHITGAESSHFPISRRALSFPMILPGRGDSAGFFFKAPAPPLARRRAPPPPSAPFPGKFLWKGRKTQVAHFKPIFNNQYEEITHE
jgi:hypothetical protein